MLKTSAEGMRCFSIHEYVLADGHSPFDKWLIGLSDSQTRASVRAQLDRFSLGRLEQYAALADGVFELRLTRTPRYRVYFGLHNGRMMLLLSGGARHSSQKDLQTAKLYWENFSGRDGGATRRYQDSLSAALRNPREAAAYINAALDAGDRRAYLLAVQNVTSSIGLNGGARFEV